jgi:putative copper resistance protein D
VFEPIVLARAVHFAATVLAAGTVCFLVLVAEPALATSTDAGLSRLRQRCNLMVWAALGIALLSGAAWLALLGAEVFDAPAIAVLLDGRLWPVLTGTQFGAVWSMRLALAVALALLLVRPGWRWLQLAAASALIGLLAFVGHAGATPGSAGDVHVASDIAHLIAAGAWLGGLPALALLLLSPQEPDRAARATRRFSVLGLVCVATLIVSGLINSWNLLGAPSDLIATDYGRLLTLKLALFVAMLGIAAVNRFHFTPLLQEAGARRALARNSLAESGLGLGIIVLVATLGTMAPPTHAVLPPVDIPADAAFVHIHTEEAMADVTVNPGRSGPVTVSIRVLNEDSSEFPTSDVHLELDPPAAGTPPLSRAAVRQPDGTWTVGGVALPQAGNWTVRVIIAAQHGQKIVLDAPIVIERAR